MAWIKYNVEIDNFDPESSIDEIVDNTPLLRTTEYRVPKQGMRVRWARHNTPQIEWYSDLNHGTSLWNPINGYIKKNVGKPFAEVYSAFVNNSKYTRNMDRVIGYWGDTPRDVFNDCFERYERGRRYDGLFVDEEGIIRDDSKPRYRNRDIKIYLPREQTYTKYRLRTERLGITLTVLQENVPEWIFFKIARMTDWQKKRYTYDEGCPWELLYKYCDRLHEALNHYRAYREDNLRYCKTIDRVCRFMFEQHYVNFERIIKAGTREWYEYRKQMAKKKKTIDYGEYYSLYMKFVKRYPLDRTIWSIKGLYETMEYMRSLLSIKN